MHIPDGFLSRDVSLFSFFVSGVILFNSFKNIKKSLTKERVPFLASLAAFVFAVQMLNFPVLGGTSGHLVGGALLGILVGFDASVLIMSIVLVVQALVFHDGGVTALGANIFNMAIVAPAIGVYFKQKFSSQSLAVFAAGIISVVSAAAMVAVQLSLSETIPFLVVFPAMTSIHLLIGLAEGVLSIAVVKYVLALNPAKITAEAIE